MWQPVPSPEATSRASLSIAVLTAPPQHMFKCSKESAILEIPMRSLRRRLLRYVGDFGRCKFRAGSDGSTNSHLEV